MNEFYKEITDWLLPLGYKEFYRINHPTDDNMEWHFIKDKIRIVCIKQHGKSHFYLNKDILNLKEICSLRTGNYPIKSPKLEELHNFVLNTTDKLTANLYTLNDVRSLLTNRDGYLYYYYTTYKEKDIPLITIEEYLNDDHEYLLDRKITEKPELYTKQEVYDLMWTTWQKAEIFQRRTSSTVLNPPEMHEFIRNELNKKL